MQIMSTQEVIHRDTAVIMALIIIRMIPAAIGNEVVVHIAEEDVF